MAFYFLDNNELLEAPNFVIMQDIELNAAHKDEYTLPINGWYWFDTIEQAKEFFKID